MKRFFYIDDFDIINNDRGFHANKNCDEILFIVNGSIHIKLINKKNEVFEKTFDKNEYCYIKSNTDSIINTSTKLRCFELLIS